MQGKNGKNFFSRLKDTILADHILLSAFIGLIILGTLAQYSANYPDNMKVFIRHIVYLIISLSIFLIAITIPLKLYFALSPILYSFCLFLLFLLLFKGSGVKRWIEIGNFQFQPSEIAKLSIILISGRIISLKNLKKEIIITGILTLVFASLVVIQPDLGTAVVISLIFAGIIFSTGIDIFTYFLIISPFVCIISSFHILSAVIFFIILSFALYFSRINIGASLLILFLNIFIGSLTPILLHLLKPYQRERLLIFLNPYKDPSGSGWHILQSKISIGSGGIIGKGFLKGTLKSLKFIPMKNTDFIFSVIGEEFGFLGTLLTFTLFFILLYRLLTIIYTSKGNFSKIISSGIFFYFFTHSFINMGMCLGILPVVGLPLPFISYGGTNLLISTILIGIALNIRKNIYEYF